MAINWSHLAPQIRKMTSDSVNKGVHLDAYTTFKIGGPASMYIEPGSLAEFAEILSFADKNKLPLYVLGGGSNLLISDDGVDGLVINTKSRLNSLSRDKADSKEVIVTAECGVPLGYLLNRCMHLGLSGVEILAGIPATVGGAVVMNAGVSDGSIGDLIRSVTFYDAHEDEIRTLEKEYCEFDYRSSIFQTKLRHAVVFRVELVLKNRSSEEIRSDIVSRINQRKNKQPLEYPNAGCIFQNPEGYSAGYLIDRAGWNGFRAGGALVSREHANFIVNTGKATAKDVMKLIEAIRSSVFEKFGVRLQLELKTWGVSELD